MCIRDRAFPVPFSQIEQPVGRAPHACGSPIEDVCVDLGRADVPVTEELLNGADVMVVLEQVGGEGVPKRVTRRALRNARATCCLPHRPLQHGLVQVVPAALAGDAIHVEPGRRKHPLPHPLPPRVRVLARQRPRQFHSAGAALQIALVLSLDSLQVPGQVGLPRGGEHGDPILVTLAPADHDLIGREVDVLDP